MHIRHNRCSSPLAFDPEIERTTRSNQVTKRNINTMSVDNVVVADVIEGHENAVNNPLPLVPPVAPQFPNNNNKNNRNNNVGPPIITPVQPQLNRNNHGHYGGNSVQYVGGNGGNHNGGNGRNHNIILEMLVLNLVMWIMGVTRMTGTFMMEVTMTIDGIKSTTVVIGGIKGIGVETGTTTKTGTNIIFISVAPMTSMIGSKMKALEIIIEGIQTVDSTVQMEGTMMKVINYLTFTFRNLLDNLWRLIFIRESMMMPHICS
uniref:Uncharacterized protein n=1 Tax=Lactuca sativa TaxID=4236 RepID=A0A9R1UW84_LACSA|nr:hypothetical protein LSAT_V11C800416700 [Lactuca sativa]